MRFSLVAIFTLAGVALAKPLNNDFVSTVVTEEKTCTRPTQRGDKINVHYRGTLESDGSEFDASYNRGQPLSFTVGKGQVCNL